MKKCKQGYYYCYTDEKCKPIPQGLKMTARFSGGGREPEETGIDVPTNGNNQNGNGNGNGNSNGGSNGGGVSEGTLHKWFKGSKSKDGKGGWVNVVTGGTCASDEPGEGTPKCVSSAKRASMSKSERLSAARRKKKADPGQQQKSGAAKPTYVSTDPKKKMKKEEVEIIEGKDKKGKGSGTKDACYHKVKSRYSVWPSAYASGALVKCRKVGAANWGNSTKKESYELSNWRDDFKATEYEFIDLIKPEPLKGETLEEKKAQKCWPGYEKKGTKKMFGKTYNNCVKKEEVEEIDEGKYSSSVRATYGGKTETFPVEVYKKKAKKVEVKEGDGDPCWDTHKQVGMKKKGGKMVPNCVPKEEKQIGGGNLKKLAGKAVKRVDADVDGDVDTKDMKSSETGEFVPSPTGKKLKPKVRFEQSDWRLELEEGAAWTKKSGKNPSGGLNEKGRKSYERENPGSDLKRPSKEKGNKRRASFCARMKGMKKKLTSSKTANDPDSRINKSLRAWDC